jgi:hypothetical protein
MFNGQSGGGFPDYLQPETRPTTEPILPGHEGPLSVVNTSWPGGNFPAAIESIFQERSAFRHTLVRCVLIVFDDASWVKVANILRTSNLGRQSFG